MAELLRDMCASLFGEGRYLRWCPSSSKCLAWNTLFGVSASPFFWAIGAESAPSCGRGEQWEPKFARIRFSCINAVYTSVTLLSCPCHSPGF